MKKALVVALATTSVIPTTESLADSSIEKTDKIEIDKSNDTNKNIITSISTQISVRESMAGTVTADSLNVRSKPSTSGTLLGKLIKGERVQLLSKENTNWYKINYKGKSAYISSNYVKVDSKSEDIPITTLNQTGKVINVASNDVLNARELPNSTSKIQFTLKNNTTTNVIGKTSNNWYKISHSNKTAFVNSKYIQLIENQTPAPPENTQTNQVGVYKVKSSINLRFDNSWSGKVFKAVNTGTLLNVVGFEEGWAKILEGDKTLYAPANYLEFDSSIKITKYKPTSSINLRNGSYWQAGLIRVVTTSDVLDVVGFENGWAKVLDGSILAYAPANYLATVGSENTQTPVTPPVTPSETIDFTVTTYNNLGRVYNVSANDVLNVRANPTSKANILHTLKNDEEIKITGITSNDWYEVNVNGKVGYCSKKYIEVVIPTTTTCYTTDAINLRYSNSWTGKIFKAVSKNTDINVINISGAWAEIFYENQILYAPANYLLIKEDNTITPDNGVTNPDNGVTNPEINTVYTNYEYTINEFITAQQKKNSKYNSSYYEGYINPDKCLSFEFLRLDKFRNIEVSKLNNMIKEQNAGVLINQGQSIIDTARKYNIDPLYFISQSLHETGYGKSTLAKGVTITEIANESNPITDANGNITGYEMIPLNEPVTVYNLFGIGAKDNLSTMPNRALILGTTTAYNKGWTSIEKAIEGAGEFVSSNYVNSSKYHQNTLYKIRFNPSKTYAWHEYATTPWYSREIAKLMHKYEHLYSDKTTLNYDKPMFIK